MNVYLLRSVLLFNAIVEGSYFQSYSRVEDHEMKYLNLSFFPYERCLVHLDNLDGNYSYSTQQACLASSAQAYPPEILPGQTSKSKSQGLQSACQLGFGHGGQGGLTARRSALNPDGDKCVVRKISQRTGIRSIWTSMTVTDIHTGRLLHLFELFSKLSVKHVAYVGDSMTMQVSKFFGCDLSRTPGVQTLTNHHLLKYSNKLDQSATFEYGDHSLYITAHKSQVACTYGLLKSDGCDSKNISIKRAAVYGHLKATLINNARSGTPTSPMVLVYNAGLHVFPSNRDWMIEPTVRALLTAAKESRGRFFVLFREVSAQHFTARLGGCFDGPTSPKYRPGKDFCCGPLDPAQADAENWRSRMFLEEFERQEPLWRRYVGWVPFFNTTAQLFDMHLESNNVYNADCTHYVYTPFLLAPHWVDFTNTLSQLSKYPAPNITDILSKFTADRKAIKGASKKVYMMDKGKKRLFTDWALFLKMGIASYDIEQIADFNLDAIPSGPDMTWDDAPKA